MVADVTEASFEADVLMHDRPVLVDFWASWCPPCKMMEPVLDRLEEEYAGRARLAKVNVDRNPSLAERLGIRGVPTYIVFQRGEAIARLTAAQTEGKLRGMLDQALRAHAESPDKGGDVGERT